MKKNTKQKQAVQPPAPPAKQKAVEGRKPFGLYPTHNRTAMAMALVPPMSTSTVSHILLGKRGATLAVALQLARVVGVEVEQFLADWQGQRKLWLKKQKKVSKKS
jgi:plasmid maintenance system antidote protein VapI